MRAVFLDQGTMGHGDVDFSRVEAVVGELVAYQATTPEQVAERIAGADIVIVNKVKLSRAHLEAARPRLVTLVATGYDNVDVAACRDYGIVVSNVRGYGTNSVAQHAIGLLLALATRLIDYRDDVRAGTWQRSTHFCFLDHPIVELAGKTLGVAGLGNLGGRTAQLASALGMRILVAQIPGSPGAGAPLDDATLIGLGADPHALPGPDSAERRRWPLDELLPEIDALTLHCPLTPATRNMIDGVRLARMKPSAFLINTGRGGLVDEQALADALRSGVIAGAGVDVLSGEPPRDGNPLLAADIPNLIVTPHIAWGTREARQRVCDQLAENIASWVAGQPTRVVGG